MSMPQAKRRTAAQPRPTRPSPRGGNAPGKLPYEVTGIALIILGLLLLLATRIGGSVPSFLLSCMQWFFGSYGAWGISIAMILLGFFLIIHLANIRGSVSIFGMTWLFLTSISLAQLTHTPAWDPKNFTSTPGGLFGGMIGGLMVRMMGQSAAWIVLIGFLLIGISIMSATPLWMILVWPLRAVYKIGKAVFAPWSEHRREERAEKRAQQVAALQEEELKSRRLPKIDCAIPPKPVIFPTAMPPRVHEPEPEPIHEPFIEEKPAPPPVRGVPSKEKPGQLQFADDSLSNSKGRKFDLPPVDLLSVTPKSAKASKEDTSEKVAALEQTLSSFSIDAKVVAVERGPRVTRFELLPPPGIRINRITNLADDIALSLSALDVRVEAPVPGKGVVGIEVPNKESVIVDLRDIIESEPFTKSKSPITFSLGRDITGHPRVADLSRMPHLLIAGATNSGKSVCINSLICSILMRATPQQVKFLMVDPKRVELSLFQSIPHLIAPVAYDAKHAAGLLRWAIREMEQRYEMFAEKGVRNIVGFNEQSRMEGLEELPYIVIIIDELADLMMQAAAEFEASICRIAQLARATGIHLVVATQRPSVNVITGTIKANIPSRIAFAVASQVDSRTILDMNGAERLVGQGDMLYLPVDASKPVRIQGAYVSERDTNRIVGFVKEQGKPHFTDEIVAIEEAAMRLDDGDESFSDEPEDELFAKALDYVRTTKYASTSMLQRKFRIGYTRAARIMDEFEERGYVGPGQGSKPREVIFAPPGSVTGPRQMPVMGDEEEFDEMMEEE